MRHIGYLESDPMVKRLCGLSRVPTAHTVGRWLRSFDAGGVAALLGVNEQLVGQVIARDALRRLTLDVDGSVVSTGLQVQGARRGFNPHRRKVPSYYPITAHEANTGQVLRVANRAGNVNEPICLRRTVLSSLPSQAPECIPLGKEPWRRSGRRSTPRILGSPLLSGGRASGLSSRFINRVRHGELCHQLCCAKWVPEIVALSFTASLGLEKLRLLDCLDAFSYYVLTQDQSHLDDSGDDRLGATVSSDVLYEAAIYFQGMDRQPAQVSQ